ncbi:MAG: DUF4157 domain-containing protein [bacterium]|nr:DUF4157 domain-containing protein [bacterium]
MQHTQQHRKPAKAKPGAKESTPSHAQSLDTAPEPLGSETALGTISQIQMLRLQRRVGNQAVLRLVEKQKAQAVEADTQVQRLPDTLNTPMQKMFGGAAQNVRIHQGEQADQVARQHDADAVTMGSDIYFREGAYRPGTAAGNALIARQMAQVAHGEMGIDPHSAASQRDAQETGNVVQRMGANPGDVLQPIANNKVSPVQREVLQRYSHSRTAGIVTSKVVQGIFTTVLGPVGLVWRWPLIQKNIGEAMGTKVGTREGKEDDKLRYGGGALGAVMRALSVYGEVLKEILIWLGFATFIAAIVTAATHGAAGPVFAVLAAITGGVGIGLAAIKLVLVGLNGYRLRKAKKLPDGKDKDNKIAHIKHQMVTDGLDGISGLLSGIFGILGASGVPSAGGELAKAAGVSEPAQKLAGFGLSSATQGLGTSVVTNTGKEGGKDYVKPGKEEGLGGGFFKDANEIKNAYKPTKVGKFFSYLGSKLKKKKPTEQDAPVDEGGGDSPEKKEVLEKVPQILVASQRNTVDQGKQSGEAKSDLKLIEETSGKSGEVVKSMTETKSQFDTAENDGKQVDKVIDKSVEETVSDESSMETITAKVNEGLSKSGEPTVKETTGIQNKGRFGAWFARKIGGLKAGVRRLNNRILKAVIKFATRLRKPDVDPSVIPVGMAEERQFSAQDVQDEQRNDELFTEYQSKAQQANAGVNKMAELE